LYLKVKQAEKKKRGGEPAKPQQTGLYSLPVRKREGEN